MVRGPFPKVTILFYAGGESTPPVRDPAKFRRALGTWQEKAGGSSTVGDFERSEHEEGDSTWELEGEDGLLVRRAQVESLVRTLLPLATTPMVVIAGSENRGRLKWVCSPGVGFNDVKIEEEDW